MKGQRHLAGQWLPVASLVEAVNERVEWATLTFAVDGAKWCSRQGERGVQGQWRAVSQPVTPESKGHLGSCSGSKASSLIQSSFAAVTCQLLAGATRERGQFSLPRWCTQEERSTMPTQPSVAPNDSLSDSALFNCLHLQVKARGNALSFNFVFTRSGAN